MDRTISEQNATTTTIETIPTLGPNQKIWNNYIIETSRAIGRVGRRQSGSHVHLLRVETVVGIVDEAKELAITWRTVGHNFLRTRTPQIFSAGAPCNSNGQHVGTVVAAITDENKNSITCRTCRTAIGLTVAPAAAPVVNEKEVGWTIAGWVRNQVERIEVQPIGAKGRQTIFIYVAKNRNLTGLGRTRGTLSGLPAKINLLATLASVAGILVTRNDL